MHNAAMKKLSLANRACRAVLCAWLLFSALTAISAQPEFFSKLGLSESDARGRWLEAVTSGSVPYFLAAKLFLAAPAAERAAMVKEAVAWAKSYSASAPFAAEYKKWLEQNQPRPPQKQGGADEMLAKQRQEFDRQIADMKKAMKDLPAEMRPQMEATIKEMEANMKKQESDPQFREAMAQELADMQQP